MSERILEVGAGDRPAIMNPGLLFEKQDVEYVGVDASRKQFPPKVPNLNGTRVTWQRLSIVGAMANVGDLPFFDRTFDYVVMKNVLGEYSLRLLKHRSKPSSTDTLSGRSFKETIGGLADVYRVLNPSGRVVISEEDTPARPDIVADRLDTIGFSSIVMLPYRSDLYDGLYSFDTTPAHEDVRHISPDPEWLAERTTYWGISDRLHPDGYVVQADTYAIQHYSSTYLMTAVKSD